MIIWIMSISPYNLTSSPTMSYFADPKTRLTIQRDARSCGREAALQRPTGRYTNRTFVPCRFELVRVP